MPTTPRPTPPRWAIASAAIAPTVLVSGWIIAAALQPPGFSSVDESISALAGHGTAHRLVMTFALGILGCCHLVTAAGLTSIRPSARVTLACGGAATILVTAFPQPVDGTTVPHVASASAAFLALAIWAGHAGANGRPAPLDVRSGWTAMAVIGISILLMLAAGQAGTAFGLAERASTTLQSLWPLAVVIALRKQANIS